jgi:hypothetical protein
MDPISRLQLARDEINKIFGVGYARARDERARGIGSEPMPH